jgi:hypothetical protein
MAVEAELARLRAENAAAAAAEADPAAGGPARPACRSVAASAGVSSACSTRMPAPSRTQSTGAPRGRVWVDDGVTRRVTSVATATFPARSASPSTPGGITLIYKDLIANEPRTRQVIADVATALAKGRNCLVLTNWTAHLDKLADALRALGYDPVILRGGMGAKARAAALARLQPQPGGLPLLAVATGPYAGEGFDCPALDTLFLAAPIAQKGRLVQYVGRILRAYDGKGTAEVHDYHDELTGVLASSLAKRAPGYTSLGFPDPRKLPYTPSATAAATT